MISITENQVTLFLRNRTLSRSADYVVCKTVHIFAYSSTREQSNKRSRTRLKRLARFERKTLTARFTDFFTDFEKKNPTVLQSTD